MHHGHLATVVLSQDVQHCVHADSRERGAGDGGWLGDLFVVVLLYEAGGK